VVASIIFKHHRLIQGGDKMDRTRVVVMMEGGLIHGILSDVDTEVLILDADTEGADENQVKEIALLDDEGNLSNMKEENYISMWDVPGEPNIVQHYFKQAREVEDD
jgi:hypothetical protein